MARRKARELAFQTLFQAQRGDHPLWEVWREVRISAAEQLEEEEDDVYGDPLDYESLEFAQQLLQHFDDNQQEVDEVLSSSLKGWTFSQMSQTDVTILRLAVSEWRYLPDIPVAVTIEVAVRIAKKFGGEESGRFVNGVLARLVNVDEVLDTSDGLPEDVADEVSDAGELSDAVVGGSSDMPTNAATDSAVTDVAVTDTADTADTDTAVRDTEVADKEKVTVKPANDDAAVLS